MSAPLTVSRALLLFGIAMTGSLLFSAFRAELGLVTVIDSRIHFGLFWGASLVSTWWGTSAAPPWLRWSARGAGAISVMAAALPMTRFFSAPSTALVAQDAPTLVWATLFSASFALAVTPYSAFFGRSWWVLVGYRLLLHAGMWAAAFFGWPAGPWYGAMAAIGQAVLLVLLAFSWLTLRFPETASEAR